MKKLFNKDNAVFLLLGTIVGVILTSLLLGVMLWANPQMAKSLIDPMGAARLDGTLSSNPELLQLNVNVSKVIRPISPLIYGSNLTAKTEFENDIAQFGNDIGLTIVRFPGSADGYRWQLGKFDFNQRFDNAPLAKIGNVIKFCGLMGSKLVLQVNIETGTPQEAAQWVQYMNMNKENTAPVTYWELGNEVYGNWEKVNMTGEEYVKVIQDYSKAMKEVDPTIKIGANLGGPNFSDFDEAVIKFAADSIDFISYHWYPNHINKKHAFEDRVHPLPEEIMANSLAVSDLVKRVDKLLERYAPHRKGKIEVAFLEWDGSWDAPASDLKNDTQAMMWSLANAIFYADTLGQFALHGVTLANNYNFEEVMFGLIRGWDEDAGWGGSPWDRETIRPKALALKLMARHFGDSLIESELIGSPVFYYKGGYMRADSYQGEVPYVSAYASTFSDQKKIAILLVNKHAQKDFKVKVSLEGMIPTENGKAFVLNGPDISAQNDGNPRSVSIQRFEIQGIKKKFIYHVAAHSVNLMEINF